MPRKKKDQTEQTIPEPVVAESAAAEPKTPEPDIVPFATYDDYMREIFDCVNRSLDQYLEHMKSVYDNGQGGYKNVLYPDLGIASDAAREQIARYREHVRQQGGGTPQAAGAESEGEEEDAFDESELLDLFGAFAVPDDDGEEEPETQDERDSELMDAMSDFLGGEEALPEEGRTGAGSGSLPERILSIEARAEAAMQAGTRMPFHDLARRMEFEPFTLFCFACGILSSTQTDYAGIFQIVNENGSLSSPTIESAAKLYFGEDYSITGAYGDMSTCLEQLLPVLDLHVSPSMPFSTAVSPDKRIIDFLFGRHPEKLDENYSRFIKMLTDNAELDPILANEGQLEAMKISYREGSRIFALWGDEGSGRKFFIKLFCRERGQQAISLNCKKLFVYDFQFVEKALWAVTRECLLTNACCVLEELEFREDEKEKFYGYMDLAFGKLTQKKVTVFALSKLQLAMRDITREDFTDLEIPTPDNGSREICWHHFSQGYDLTEEVDLLEMATKFLFTPGKIKAALAQAKKLAIMDKEEVVTREKLFKGCYDQMSSELTQKATKIKANFGFEDIVMSVDQRTAIERAIDQMTYRKDVYEGWHYTKKYPYGRGLSVLLFGAPGTGKSMCAQVIAHELNLELYRVDLSKVIDKYVGETEKSISMIFREAKKCNVVLFFDECDTLFAKRADDGGSNQASNNNKTALLLQEVEGYDGVSVLATNYKHNIDPAFFRRMKYIVEFQKPDPDTREMLWRTTIPKDTPLADDVDIRFLAEKYDLVGGNIKNCILNAAFLAVADKSYGDGKVHMKHYLQAVQSEFVKVGGVLTRGDFAPYDELIFGKSLY